MSAVQLAMRMLCSEARIDAQKMRRGQLNDLHWSKLMKAFTRLAAAPVFIDETSGITVQEIRAKAKRLQADRGLDLIVIDYLQLMGSVERTENRQQEISTISRSLKKLASDLKVPVLALAQLSRAPDQRQGDHRPILSDLRESGSLEQDADVVMFIFREEVIRIREGKDPGDKKGVAEIIIAKQRNGPVDTVKLAFIKEWTRFENLQREGAGGAPLPQPPPPERDGPDLDDAAPF
jgi:replicative DNA helicase